MSDQSIVVLTWGRKPGEVGTPGTNCRCSEIFWRSFRPFKIVALIRFT